MRRNLTLISVVSLVLMVGLSATSTATNYETCLLSSSSASDSCPPHLMFNFGGKVAPKWLPKHKMAPVVVTIQGKVATDNGVQPSALREMTILLDRSFAVNVTGLSTCKRSQLEHGYRAAVRMCRTSIVGAGTAHVEISSQQQGLIHLPLTIFNGGIRGNVRTLFISSSTSAQTPLLATAAVSKLDKGRYGLQVVSKIPRIANGAGSLRNFTFKVERLFSAKCLDGQLDASASPAIFKNETKVQGVPRETTLRESMAFSCTPKD